MPSNVIDSFEESISIVLPLCLVLDTTGNFTSRPLEIYMSQQGIWCKYSLWIELVDKNLRLEKFGEGEVGNLLRRGIKKRGGGRPLPIAEMRLMDE